MSQEGKRPLANNIRDIRRRIRSVKNIAQVRSTTLHRTFAEYR